MKTSFILVALIIHFHIPQTKRVFSPIFTGRYNCVSGNFEAILANNKESGHKFKSIAEADEFVTDIVGSSFPFDVLEMSVLEKCSGKPFEMKSIPSRSITLLTRDNQPVKLNGKSASTGARLRKSATIETPPYVGATITGLRSRVDVSPNSSFSVGIDSQAKLALGLHYGCIEVKAWGTSPREVLVAGKVYKFSSPAMCRNDSEPPVEMDLPAGHAGVGSAMGVKPSKGLPTPPESVYPIRWATEKDQVTFELGNRVETRGGENESYGAQSNTDANASQTQYVFFPMVLP